MNDGGARPLPGGDARPLPGGDAMAALTRLAAAADHTAARAPAGPATGPSDAPSADASGAGGRMGGAVAGSSDAPCAGVSGAGGLLAGPSDRPAEAVVLVERGGVTVVRVGDAVAKAHTPETDVGALAARVALAGDPALAGVLLPPAPPGGHRPGPHGPGGGVASLPDGRAATAWPYGVPVDPAGDPDAVPWEVAGRLLAALHAVDPESLATPRRALPTMAGPARTARAVARMREVAGHAAARRAVERVWSGLPAWCRGEVLPPGTAVLCHGDFHLGQLVRRPGPHGRWLLIDVDDLGLGDPAWDLARPAAWYAAGLLAPAYWHRLLAGYQPDYGLGPGPDQPDPWPRLDAPARALTAHFACRAVLRADRAGKDLTPDEEAFVDACVRIARSAGAGSV